jgi:hypothetical protein
MTPRPFGRRVIAVLPRPARGMRLVASVALALAATFVVSCKPDSTATGRTTLAIIAVTPGTASLAAEQTQQVGALATITVTANAATVAPGATRQFRAVGRDAHGNVITIIPIWRVTAGGGTISTSGRFTAGPIIGTFANTVTATSGAMSGAATAMVAAGPPGPVATITVTPNPASVAAGTTQRFTAVARDASGNVVIITPVWSVAAGGGTIGTKGLFTAGAAAGTFTNSVTATAGAASGTAIIATASGSGIARP